jgi:hypothetical protein
VILALYRETEGDLSARVDLKQLLEKYGIDVEKQFWLNNLQNEWAGNRQAQFIDAGTASQKVAIEINGVRVAESLPNDLLPEIDDIGATEQSPESSDGSADRGKYGIAFDDPESVIAAENFDGSFPRDSDPPYPGRAVESLDSASWTGKQFALVDAKVIVQVKAAAIELQAAVYSLNFRTDADRDDIRGLVDALVAITKMSEPEVNLIDRILASPKFKGYASLFGIIATIRGALGI